MVWSYKILKFLEEEAKSQLKIHENSTITTKISDRTERPAPSIQHYFLTVI